MTTISNPDEALRNAEYNLPKQKQWRSSYTHDSNHDNVFTVVAISNYSRPGGKFKFKKGTILQVSAQWNYPYNQHVEPVPTQSVRFQNGRLDVNYPMHPQNPKIRWIGQIINRKNNTSIGDFPCTCVNIEEDIHVVERLDVMLTKPKPLKRTSSIKKKKKKKAVVTTPTNINTSSTTQSTKTKTTKKKKPLSQMEKFQLHDMEEEAKVTTDSDTKAELLLKIDQLKYPEKYINQKSQSQDIVHDADQAVSIPHDEVSAETAVKTYSLEERKAAIETAGGKKMWKLKSWMEKYNLIKSNNNRQSTNVKQIITTNSNRNKSKARIRTNTTKIKSQPSKFEFYIRIGFY
jgi:hypothetical protein